VIAFLKQRAALLEKPVPGFRACVGPNAASSSLPAPPQRLLTVVQTLRRREQSVLDSVANAVVAHRHELPIPKRLPDQSSDGTNT
jgi:hypothetical protein